MQWRCRLCARQRLKHKCFVILYCKLYDKKQHGCLENYMYYQWMKSLYLLFSSYSTLTLWLCDAVLNEISSSSLAAGVVTSCVSIASSRDGSAASCDCVFRSLLTAVALLDITDGFCSTSSKRCAKPKSTSEYLQKIDNLLAHSILISKHTITIRAYNMIMMKQFRYDIIKHRRTNHSDSFQNIMHNRWR